MSFAKRTDANQIEVVKDLRKALPECRVFVASGTGDGFPDLVVGWNGYNFLFEVKDPEKPASKRSLTDAQKEFHGSWQGQASVVHSAAEICAEIARYILKHK
jgi:hypothetical protein